MKFLWGISLLSCCLFSILNASESDYYLNEGFDFSNGRSLVSKFIEKNGKSQPLWTRYAKDSCYSDVYRKYQLGNSSPLVGYASGTGYQTNYFIRVKTMNRGWKFWRWEWYFFTDVPSACWDGYLPMFDLLHFLQQNDVPRAMAREWYDGCVKRFNDQKALNKYIAEVTDEYEKKDLLKEIAKIIVTGDRMLYEKISPARVGRMILKYREKFPEQLPDGFLTLATELDSTYRLELDSSKTSFLLQEYRLHPTEKNARYLLSAYVQKLLDQENCLDLSWLFQSLNKNGLLEKFVGQLDLSPKEFPPLPAPVTRPKDGVYLCNVYYTDTYAGLPERENLLRISCNPLLFKGGGNPMKIPVFKPEDFFTDFQIKPDTVSFQLKKTGLRFLVSRRNESRKTEYGESFSLKPGEKLSFSDGRHLSLDFAFLPKSQLNAEQQWLVRKTGYPGENVLVVTDFFRFQSFGTSQVKIRDIMMLSRWKGFETSSFRTIFLNIHESADYVVLSRNRPKSVMDAIPMRTNTYEDVLLRIKDGLRKILAETSPFPVSSNGWIQVFQLTDHPDENVFMQHYFEVKDVFSVELTPTTGFRSNIEILIPGVKDRTMFIYTKFNSSVTPEFRQKIKQLLTRGNLLIRE